MKKRSPSSGQNSQLLHWWLLVRSGHPGFNLTGSSIVKLLKGCWFPLHFIYTKIEKKLRGNLIFPVMSLSFVVYKIWIVLVAGFLFWQIFTIWQKTKEKGEGRGGRSCELSKRFFWKKAQSYHISRKKKYNSPYLVRSIKKAGSNTYGHQL